ncbi:MAG: hypothetical protein KKB34_15555 [Bacteroidetes bacterium]|nr:hypothetical protein [Bacteroidota bacterium]
MLKKIVFFLILGSLLWACSSDNDPVKSAAELQERVTKLNSLNDDLDAKRTQLYSLVRDFNSSRPEGEQFDIASIDTALGKEESDLLKAMFKDEKDISYNGLLNTIIEKNEEVASLNNQITEMEAKLPKPIVVKNGDTHYGLVRDFLMTQHGMDKKQAREIAWKTAMIDDIVPGNKIWLAYSDGIVGTYVTQGDAKVSPMTVQILAKKRAIDKAYEQGKNESQKQDSVYSTPKATESVSMMSN